MDKGNSDAARTAIAGFKFGACWNGQFANNNTNPQVYCPAIAALYLDQTTDTNVTGQCIPARIVLDSSITDKTTAKACGTPSTATALTTKTDTVKPGVVSADFVLGSMYQSNGLTTVVNGSAWCNNGDTDANVNNLYTKVTSSAEITVQGMKGLGPKTKCTWQLIADKTDGTEAPIIELVQTPSSHAIVQVLEWFSQTHFGASEIIQADKAKLTPSFMIGSASTAYDKGDYGIYFNPLS